MRRISSFILKVLCLMVAMPILHSATPTFSSFSTNQFSTNNLLITLNDPLIVTNLTVVSNTISQTIITTNVYTTNLFATNIFNNNLYTTNVFATNLYVTNIFNDITFNGRVTFNTNVTFITNVSNANLFLGLPDFNNIRNLGSVITNYYFSNLLTGTNDLITVSAGKRLMVNETICGTTNGAITTIQWYVKTNGNYFKVSATAGLQTNNSSQLIYGRSVTLFIAEAGETVAVTCSNDGANVNLVCFELPNTLPCYSPRLYSLSAGNNTLYTVPTGKRAFMFGAFWRGADSLQIFPINDSGASRLYTWYIVPNGGSVGSGTQMRQELVNNAAAGIQFGSMAMASGDSIVISTDASTATQWAWMTVIEQ